MRHHFADFLDRNGDYWTIVPNRERYVYVLNNIEDKDFEEVKIITIGKNDNNWEKVFSLTNLEELTLHEPSKEQVSKIGKLQNIKRLRITHIRLKDIEFIRELENIEELVLEYVSGFSDLSPLKSLKKLISLHIENLRKVADFDGLSGLESLKYLRIDGTTDWKQPIDNFDFLNGLPNLEVFSLGWIKNTTSFPALLPLINLRNLKRIQFHRDILLTEEYALIEVGLPKVDGTSMEPCWILAYNSIQLPKDDPRSILSEEKLKLNHPEVRIIYNGMREINDPDSEWYYFLGRKAGRVKCTSSSAKQKCEEFEAQYNSMKKQAENIIERNKNSC